MNDKEKEVLSTLEVITWHGRKYVSVVDVIMLLNQFQPTTALLVSSLIKAFATLEKGDAKSDK